MNARQVAYELWCLHEDRRPSDPPLGGMEGLIRALQERQPDLPLERIQQGVALFLARRFRDEIARSASRQRQIFHLSLSVVRSTMPHASGRPARNGCASTFTGCAKTGESGYNEKNQPKSDPGGSAPRSPNSSRGLMAEIAKNRSSST